jgi:GT2 family glycosyltransferase
MQVQHKITSDLSIIIVNWNSKDYLDKCLASIKVKTSYLFYEIIVVDNASYDGSDVLIRNKYPCVKYIQLHENIGYSGANNIGYENSTGQKLLFLNPDTELLDNSLYILAKFLDETDSIGAVGGTLLNSDGSIQLTSVQPYPRILNQLLAIDWIQKRTPEASLWGTGPLFSQKGISCQEVEVISGAAIMLSRKAFEQVGLFSQDYFMYAEDVDLCYKLRKAGYKVLYVNDVQILHHGGKSTGQTISSNLWMKDSIYKFLKKSRSSQYAVLYRVAMALSAATRMLALSLAWPIKQRHVSQSFHKWKAIFFWSIGLKGR